MPRLPLAVKENDASIALDNPKPANMQPERCHRRITEPVAPFAFDKLPRNPSLIASAEARLERGIRRLASLEVGPYVRMHPRGEVLQGAVEYFLVVFARQRPTHE